MKPYQKLQRYWHDTKAKINTVELTQDSVGRLEQRYGVRLPDDFRDYLLYSCPKDDFGCDETMTTWWPLHRLKNIIEECKREANDTTIARDAAKYIFFADYSIWCWAWAIGCGGDENRGRVVVISGRDRFVADSFGQFVDLYIEDPKQLW